MSKKIFLESTGEFINTRPLPTFSYPWKTQFNAEYFPKIGEKNTRPSMTIPDQTLTIPELLARHARGLTLGAPIKIPYYDEENEMPDPRSLDLTEIEQYRDEYLDTVDKINKSKKADDEIKAKKQRDKEIDAEIKKRQSKPDGDALINP